MFCVSCGAKITKYSNFCSTCGEEQQSQKINFKNINLNSSVGAINNITESENSILKYNYLEIIKLFFIGMGFVALGALFAIMFLPYSIINIINILFIIFMVSSIFLIKRNIFKTKLSMNIYCFTLGCVLSASLIYYIGNLGIGIFISCISGIALIFGVAYLYALKTDEEDIFKMKSIIFKAMIALLIFEVLNIFLFGFGLFDIILSLGTIMIYSSYTLYTMKSIQTECAKEILDEESTVILSLSLITSFLNLLLHLLRLIMALKRND